MLGYKLKFFNDAKFEHMDTLGHSHNFIEFGYSMRALGYYPPYVLGRFVLDFVRDNGIGKRGSINMLWSYLTYKADGGYYGCFPQDVRKSVSNRQKMMIRKRILKTIGWGKVHGEHKALDRDAIAKESL
jgi:hypothetical protein